MLGSFFYDQSHGTEIELADFGQLIRKRYSQQCLLVVKPILLLADQFVRSQYLLLGKQVIRILSF